MSEEAVARWRVSVAPNSYAKEYNTGWRGRFVFWTAQHSSAPRCLTNVDQYTIRCAPSFPTVLSKEQGHTVVPSINDGWQQAGKHLLETFGPTPARDSSPDRPAERNTSRTCSIRIETILKNTHGRLIIRKRTVDYRAARLGPRWNCERYRRRPTWFPNC